LAWAADYRTGTGEIREVALPDGTRVWLDTASAFNKDFRVDLRRLHLVAGEILVTTAADATRPFVVDTAHGRMRALGTRFTVRLESEQTFLAVYQGAVEVRTAGTGTTVVIPAGRQTYFGADRVQAAAPADPAREAWSRGDLIARDLPLEAVVKELSRYSPGHIGVTPDVAQRRVFGTFPLRNVDATLAMLSDAAQVRIRRPLPWWTTIEAADAAGPSTR
jgi:transmembrane sensor